MIGLNLSLWSAALGKGGIRPPTGFVFLRTTPGTQMRNPERIYVIAPALSGQGVSA